MSDIVRLYCTHCTFGTSALETATADNAAKVLGYSVRASSLPEAERGRLRQVFRSIERLLSYDLPRDATAADKEKLDAASAPRRLIFLPSLGDSQVVGQVSYRSHDTAGRPGSYFADMVVSRLDQRQPKQAWSAAECLELWGADHEGEDRGGWWCDSEDALAGRAQDGDALPFAPTVALQEIREAADPDRPPFISIDVLRAFLCEEADRIDPRDPGRVIPPRWREMPAESRREFFARLMQGTIGMLSQPRETVALAVEPSLAALLFYGVCRLLPPKLTKYSGGQSGISFSTYEPFPERPMTRLVATTFLHGGAVDLPAELYQRGFACNTFLPQFKYGRVTEPQGFVSRMLDLLADENGAGVAAIDELLGAIDGLGNLTPSSLDALIGIDSLVTGYVGGRQPLFALEHAPSVQATSEDQKSFRRRRFERLIERGEAEGRTDWPEDLLATAIAWLGDDLGESWRAQGAVARVLRGQLPTTADQLKKLATSKPPQELVRDGVITVAREQKRLPDCLSEILRDFAGGPQGAKAVGLMGEIINGLDDGLRPQILLDSNLNTLGEEILAAVEGGGLLPPDVVEDLLCRVLEGKRSSNDKWNLLKDRRRLAGLLPRPAKSAAKRLDDLFAGLRTSPPLALAGRGRGDVVKALEGWTSLTVDGNRNNGTLHRWQAVFASLDGLVDLAKQRATSRFRLGGPGETEVNALLESLDKLNADPDQQWTQQRDGRRREKLALALKAARPGEDVSKLVSEWLENELKKEQRRATAGGSPGSKIKNVRVFAIVAAAIAVLAAVGGVAVYSGASRDMLAFVEKFAGKEKPSAKPQSAEEKDDKEKGGQVDDQKKSGQPHHGPTPPDDKPDRAIADGMNPPGDPNPGPPLTPAEIGLKTRFEGGNLVVEWNHDALKDTKCTLKIDGPGLGEDQRNGMNVSNKPPHVCAVSGFGKYDATLKVQRKEEPELSVQATAELAQPPAPAVTRIDLDLAEPDAPKVKVALKAAVDLQAYDGKKCSYRLKSGDKVVGETALSAAGTEVSIPIDTQAWTPDALQEATCSLLIVSPQGEGVASGPLPVQADVAGFMSRQLEQRTVFGVPNVWPLVDGKGELSDEPFLLHPFVTEEKISLTLLSPQYNKTPYPLVLNKKPEVIDAWELSLKPSKQDVSVSPIPHGEFQVDRSQPWAPRLRYVPAEKKDEKLPSFRVAAAKLIVDLSKVNAGSHELQLVKPLKAEAIKFVKANAAVGRLKDIVDKKSLFFHCGKIDKIGGNNLRVAIGTLSDGNVQLQWSFEEKPFATQVLSLQYTNDGYILNREVLRWSAKCSVVEVRGVNPTANEPVKPQPPVYCQTMLTHGCAAEDIPKIVACFESNGLKKDLERNMKPSDWEKKLGDWKAQASKLPPEQQKTEIVKAIDEGLARVGSLVKREEEINKCVDAIKDLDFTISKWSVTGRVTCGGQVSQATYIVCDPDSSTK